MQCVKCGREYSSKVYRVHKDRCKGNENAIQEGQEKGRSPVSIDEIEIIDDMTKDQLIEIAEAFEVEIDKRWGRARIIEALNGGESCK